MSTSDMDNLVIPDARPAQGFGTLLRQGRERRGIPQSELARELNLGPRLVDALEREDLTALPGPVYVRGYLRRLATALQLDEAVLQQAYLDLAGDPEPTVLRANAPVGPMREPRGGRGFPWLKLILILLIIGAALYLARFLPDDLLNPEGASGVDVSISPAPSVPLEAVSTPLPAIPVTLEPPPAESTGPAPIVGTVIDHQDMPAPAAPDISDATPGLALSVTEAASWVQVKDSHGKVILEGMLQPGTTRELAGERPFEIVVGNAAATRLSLDGQPLDLTPYTRPNGKAYIGKLGG
ncbi:MAG: RodZ domain-containing protein [Pseudomonadota bacterium]